MALKTKKFDIQDHLKTPADRAAYLAAAFEEGDAAFIKLALSDIARAVGMGEVAERAGITREGLYKALDEKLPAYAIPIFIRIQRDADTTGTFKYRKVELVQEGFNMDDVTDPIWMYHPERKEYVAFTHDRFDSLRSGAFKF